MKIHKLIIPGKLPGLNDYIRVERGYAGNIKAAGLKAEVEAEIGWEIRAQLKTLRIKSPVHITFRWIEKDTRRDKDNIAFAKKFIQDALVSMKVLEDDGWKHITGFSDEFEVDEKNPRIEVVLREVEE